MRTGKLVFLVFYNLLLPLLALLGLPAFLLKSWRRGGLKADLWQKIACGLPELGAGDKRCIYVHAVSVGEVLIACKWLKARQASLDGQFCYVLAVGTVTGLQVARQQLAGEAQFLTIYAPLDFYPAARAVLKKYRPAVVVLIEAELWPNFAWIAAGMGTPLVLLNARLSQRSQRRFAKLGSLARVYFSWLDAVALQDSADARRYASLGVPQAALHLCGSIKFDPSEVPAPDAKLLQDLSLHLAGFSAGKPLVLAASTHAGEELLCAEACHQAGAFALIVPRHVERREQICQQLVQAGFAVYLRSSRQTLPAAGAAQHGLVYLADTTGELALLTACADVVVIGKSFLAQGGQNPCEAIISKVPVIVGPNMQNFAALNDYLLQCQAVLESSAELLGSDIARLLGDASLREELAQRAYQALHKHQGACRRSWQLVLEQLKPTGK